MLLAGCGSDEDATRELRDAVAKTTSSGALSVEEESALWYGIDKQVVTRTLGIADGRNRTARYRVVSSWNGEGPPPKEAREYVHLDGQAARQGDRIYLRLATLDRRLGLRGAWVLFAPDDPAYEKADFTGLHSFGVVDGSRPIDHLRAARSVKRVGEEDGLTHYRMTIDYDRYLEMIDPTTGMTLKRQLDNLRPATRTDSHPADVWIRDDGTVARVESRIETPLGQTFTSYRIELGPDDQAPVIPRSAIPIGEALR
jgi:hypothetical protein